MVRRDPLGDRMKHQYERRAGSSLPRRTYTVIRLDGVGFKTYTRDLARPFDDQLADDLVSTAKYLCRKIQGVRLAYCQSDEISLVLTDFERPETQAWFDGDVQKMVSVSASMATAVFNALRDPEDWACFDSRVFTIPDPTEVVNYVTWRQQDFRRNSVSMLARAHLSHAALQGKNRAERLAMLAEHGTSWEELPPRYRRGTLVVPTTRPGPLYRDHSAVGEGGPVVERQATRRVWTALVPPVFTEVPAFLRSWIPVMS